MNNNFGGNKKFLPAFPTTRKKIMNVTPLPFYLLLDITIVGAEDSGGIAEVLDRWREDLWTPLASSYNSLFQDDTFHRTSLFLAVLFIRNKLREKEFCFLCCYILVVYLHIYTHTYIYLLIHRYMHNRIEMN